MSILVRYHHSYVVNHEKVWTFYFFEDLKALRIKGSFLSFCKEYYMSANRTAQRTHGLGISPERIAQNLCGALGADYWTQECVDTMSEVCRMLYAGEIPYTKQGINADRVFVFTW